MGLATPTSTEQALAHAERVEAVLNEGERDRTSKVRTAIEEEDSDGDEDAAAVRQTMPERRCWNCGLVKMLTVKVLI
ncbi:UNVERIFIED_CONTAM: hypothetical protein FKN15_016864 [Acipenser sinensis]